MGNCPLEESFSHLYRLSHNHNMIIQSILSRSSHLNHSWDLSFTTNFNDKECDNLISLSKNQLGEKLGGGLEHK